MIEVRNLTKRFGDVTAIEDVTFSVGEGQILGFLGPNGAGKTTTMRVLAGFFPASAGEAKVAGFDVFSESLEVKKRVGYLPETPPLYTEMSIDDYLRFAARIKGVARLQIESRLDLVKERCALQDWGPRLIKHLSKGYRQRVGLAQALIHDPQVLILDEPTVGLDPRQIIEVRELIKGLGGDHTIILSTHILPEVGMTCEKVIIIKGGRIAAVDTPDNLTNQIKDADMVELSIKSLNGEAERLPEILANLASVSNIQVQSPNAHGLVVASVEVRGEEDLRPQIARTIIEAGLDLYDLSRKRLTLEEIFLELTTEEEQIQEEPSGQIRGQRSTTEVPDETAGALDASDGRED